MIKKLIERPVAVSMILVSIIALGIVATGILPVSLMPDVDIPKITVQCTLPGASAREVDRTVIRPLKNHLVRTASLADMECEARNGGGSITMQFEHGAKIDYIFIEVNEKVDQALSAMPEGMQRPKIIKASASDIPVFFIDVTTDREGDEAFIELSSFANEVIKKRLEQIPEIAFVDVSGTLGYKIVIEPRGDRLKAIGKSPEFIADVIERNNVNLGSLTVRNGYYRWTVAFDKEIRSAGDIGKIVVNADGRIYRVDDLADIKTVPAEASGIVRSDGRRAVTMAVVKQADAGMDDLDKSLDALLGLFAEDYPDMDFKVSRSQTELLDYSIGNLKDNILLGAILAVLIIFLFMRDVRSSMLVVITIPVSMVVTLLLLYLLGIGINIISLSGLILGLGMMVDNSIIVIDNITQYRERGIGLKEAAVKGAAEVITPMLSSVLTTCSVFLPLIFLSGMAGALFYDQAMAVTVGLFSSLAVAVLVIPVYYAVFYSWEGKGKRKASRRKELIDYDRIYESGLKWCFRHPRVVWSIFLLMIPLAVLLFWHLEKSQLPPITRDDTLVTVDWNEPLAVEESDRRISGLFEDMDGRITYTGIMSGHQDFILSHTAELGSSQSQVYVEVSDPECIGDVERKIRQAVAAHYPYASVEFSEPANIFNLIFSGSKSDIVAGISAADGSSPGPDELDRIIGRVSAGLPGMQIEPVVWEEQIRLSADPERMALYGVEYSSVYMVLKQTLNSHEILTLKDGSISVPVMLSDGDGSGYILQKTVTGRMMSDDGQTESIEIPLYEILSEHRARDLKTVVSGKDGEYYPMEMNLTKGYRATDVMETVEQTVMQSGDYRISFSGAWFDSRELIRELAFVLMISLLLLFFILAAQFESLMQPFIIMSEIVIDIFGALLLLWIFGAGINLMSLIGIVVMSGIIINDSILKVDTINRMRRLGHGLLRSIMIAGRRRLKSILMTSLTTILGIAPFLIRGNMGADLQFPLSLALIGGMIVGTVVSIFFIPLIYYEIYRRGEHRRRKEVM